jgi:hypothetical protein
MIMLPEALFGEGGVVGYVCGERVDYTTPSTITTYSSNDQLNNMTHVMAISLKINANGSLVKSNLPKD